MNKIRFGIVGAGNIAKKFAKDIRVTEHAELVAVASRSLDKAVAFAKKYDIEYSFGSYEELAESDVVDAVYIATPNSLHKAPTILFLESKKHVLIEKPISSHTKDLEEMIEASKRNKKLLMEAMWTRFIPVTKHVKEIVDNGTFGEIKSIEIEGGFNILDGIDPNHRHIDPQLAGGTLLAIGVYHVSYVLFFIHSKLINIKSDAKFTPTKVDSDCNIVLSFENGVNATLKSSFSENKTNRAILKFENHEIVFSHIWNPDHCIIDGERFEFPLKSGGFEYEIDAFCESINNNKIENEIMDLSSNRDIMLILDEVRKQIGYVFESEKEVN